MAYDPEGRATSIGVGSGVGAGYRADGLRAWKGTGPSKTYYLYDGGEPVLELRADGSVTAENVFAPDGLVARQVNFYATAGGQLNGLDDPSDPETPVRAGLTEYCFDAQGNVAQRTDSAGNVLSASAYDAYGQESSTAAQASDPWGYNGRWGYYADRETGLLYCQNRYYDPGAGRWLTRDPIGFAGGINQYGYCEGGPVGAVDPSGLYDDLPECAAELAEIVAEEDGNITSTSMWREAGNGRSITSSLRSCAPNFSELEFRSIDY